MRAAHLWLPFGRRTTVLLCLGATLLGVVADVGFALFTNVGGDIGARLIFLIFVAAPWMLVRPVRWVQIGPFGVRFLEPGSYGGPTARTIPASRIAGFEVHPMRGPSLLSPGKKPQMCIRRTDGEYVAIAPLRRGSLPVVGWPVTAVQPGLLEDWQPCLDATGQPLHWTAQTDRDFAALLWQTLQEATVAPADPSDRADVHA